MDSILNIEISMFVGSRSTVPQTVNLLEWLKDPSFVELQKRVRACATKNERDELKQTIIPAITPSGLFSKRSKDCLIRHSGFISIDIDGKDNTEMDNFSELKNILCNLSIIAYCGLSVSGQGFWALIPISDPGKHEQYYQFLINYFSRMGLNIDPACKDVARLRFYSYDPDAYFNHNAKPLQNYYIPPAPKPKPYTPKTYSGNSVPVWEQYDKTEDFIDVLEKHKWKIDYRKGRKIYFTRPGKDTGTSAEFDPVASWVDKKTGIRYIDVPMFHVYTSSAPPFVENKGYTPFNVYALLEHNDDKKAAAKSLLLKSTNNQFKISTPTKIPPKQKAVIQPAIKKELNADVITKPAQNEIVINADGYPAIWDEKPITKPGAWSSQINEFETFFNSIELPKEPIKLNSFCTVNVSQMVETHIASLKRNEGNKWFIPYIDRLNDLKTYLENRKHMANVNNS
jgi:hypothetical protein